MSENHCFIYFVRLFSLRYKHKSGPCSSFLTSNGSSWHFSQTKADEHFALKCYFLNSKFNPGILTEVWVLLCTVTSKGFNTLIKWPERSTFMFKLSYFLHWEIIKNFSRNLIFAEVQGAYWIRMDISVKKMLKSSETNQFGFCYYLMNQLNWSLYVILHYRCSFTISSIKNANLPIMKVCIMI